MGRQKGGKPIKRRATPKAGPKKRRTKVEMAEARKQEAIAKHGIKMTKPLRKSGKVRSYGIEPPSNRFTDGKIDVPPRTHASQAPPMSKPRKRELIPAIVKWLDKHEDEDRFETRHDAFKHFQEKVCEHPKVILLAKTAKRDITACDACGLLMGKLTVYG
jgi:hypothetical protein